MLLFVTVGVTGHVTDAEPRFVEIERLVNSHTLHGSESLCKLLRYLADHAVRHPGIALKEYQIATEVFGRPADFDPHLDSLVRVQAGRLRTKLSEYYSSEGVEDPIIVELPKGTYALAFHSAPPKRAMVQDIRVGDRRRTASRAPNASRVVLLLSVLLGMALVAILMLVFSRSTGIKSPEADASVPAAFRVFWRPFVANPEPPWLIFSNGAFIGRPETGLRYFAPGRDSRDKILDHYTGVGEVLAVYNLDQVFTRFHHEIRVKRGSLFSLDDAQNNNLIFVGSPVENLSLRDIPSTHEFIFQRATSGPRNGDIAIVNVHPQADEPKLVFATPGPPLTEDYAIVGLVPGMNPSRSVLILAGTTTIGTQAAAEYVCRQDSLEQLLLHLSVSDRGEMKPFEALLRVKVARGVPIATELVALRKDGQ